MYISVQSIIILVFGYLLNDRGRLRFTSSWLGQSTSTSFITVARKQTHVVKMLLICDWETEKISANCLPINPILSLTRVIINSSLSVRPLLGPGLLLGAVWYFICLSLFLSQYLSFSACGVSSSEIKLKHPSEGIPV